MKFEKKTCTYDSIELGVIQRMDGSQHSGRWWISIEQWWPHSGALKSLVGPESNKKSAAIFELHLHWRKRLLAFLIVFFLTWVQLLPNKKSAAIFELHLRLCQRLLDSWLFSSSLGFSFFLYFFFKESTVANNLSSGAEVMEVLIHSTSWLERSSNWVEPQI